MHDICLQTMKINAQNHSLLCQNIWFLEILICSNRIYVDVIIFIYMNIITRIVCYCKGRNTYKINDNLSEILHVELKVKKKKIYSNKRFQKTSGKSNLWWLLHRIVPIKKSILYEGLTIVGYSTYL